MGRQGKYPSVLENIENTAISIIFQDTSPHIPISHLYYGSNFFVLKKYVK
jgi:hypothetical protein